MSYFIVFTRESNGKRKKYGRKVYQDTSEKAKQAVLNLWKNHKPHITSIRKADNNTPAIVDY